MNRIFSSNNNILRSIFEEIEFYMASLDLIQFRNIDERYTDIDNHPYLGSKPNLAARDLLLSAINQRVNLQLVISIFRNRSYPPT